MIRIAIISVLAVTGCTDAPTASTVWIDAAYRDAAELPTFVTAASAWDAVGFDVIDHDAGLPECLGADRSLGCQLHVRISRVWHQIESEGSDALSRYEERTVGLDDRLTDPGILRIAVAHEVGHVLLEGGRDLPGGQLAIMAGTWSEVEDPDRQLACEFVNLCE